jgi:hypothetical protein
MHLPVYRIRCEGCGKYFDWTPKSHVSEIPPNYHSKACKNRKRTRLHKAPVSTCPHPTKRLYRTHMEAQRAVNEMEDPYMKPYRCRCGGIHIGHPYIKIKDWIKS